MVRVRLGVVLFVAVAAAARGQAPPVEGQFQVNSYTPNAQRYPVVAVDAQGGFVVAWESYASGAPGDTDVRARRFDVLGAPQGSDFVVNSYFTGTQRSPAVAADPGGAFLVAWDGDPGGQDIHARLYDTAGVPLGAQFRVNTYTTSTQANPAVAANGQGDFIVVWDSAGSPGTDTDGASVQGQRIDAGGNPLGAQFQVNTDTTGSQIQPAVAADSVGNFIVVWMINGGLGQQIRGRRYDAAGTPLGADFQVSTFSGGVSPAIAADAAGSFVVAWESLPNYSIEAQRFDAGGNPIGPEFQVNGAVGPQRPAIASDSVGNFVVSWQSYTSPGTDTDPFSILARRYDTAGQPLGAEFQINSYTTGNQLFASIASTPSGNFVVVWQNPEIAGQRYYYFNLGVSVVGSGTVTSSPPGITCPADCSESYASSTAVDLTPAPAPGWVFTGWSGDCTGTGSCRVAMTADRNVTATFTQQHTLTVSVVGNGVVTSSPPGISCPADCSEAYLSGTIVNLTATPASGWVFTGWSGDCTGTGSCQVLMNAARNVTATFTQQHTLTVSVVGSGVVTSSPPGITCPTDCSEAYLSGTIVDLTPAPAPGWVFTGWGGDCTGTGSCQVAMNAARSVTATFMPPHTLTVTVGSGGSVTSAPAGIACPGDCTEAYPYATQVALSATPAPLYHLVAWSGDCTGSGACSVTMTADRTVGATFDTLPFLDGFETGNTSRWTATQP